MEATMHRSGLKRRALSAAVSSLMVGGVWANPLNLADVPLVVSAGVKPNLMLAIDDSGSMDFELLTPTNDGSLWWHTDDRSFVGRDKNDQLVGNGILNFSQAGDINSTWIKYSYLFPNGTGTGNRILSDSQRYFAVPPIQAFAFARSAAFNGMYYDPMVSYAPWPSIGSKTWVDANPKSARSHPGIGTMTFDLTQMRKVDASNNRFALRTGMVIPAGTTYSSSGSANTWITAGSDTKITSSYQAGVAYFPATYYTVTEAGSDQYALSADSGWHSCATPNPAHYTEMVGNPSGFVSDTVSALGPDGQCLLKHEIKPETASYPSGRSYASELQNFANWFQYHRKRHLALRAGAGEAFAPITGIRTSGFTINDRDLEGVWDIDLNRGALYDWLYGITVSGGTPNREALNYAGQQFNTNPNVITHACQQNFALLFTDGFSYAATISGINNQDGGMGAPYEDSASSTIADVAMRYYKTPLRSDLPTGQVPVPAGCSAGTVNPWVNCNRDLHMVTYGVTLGAKGHIFGTTHFSILDAYDDPPQWLAPTQNANPVQVDDLYHAAINGRGDLLNASSSTELRDTLTAALNSILAQTKGSSSSAAANSGFLGTDTLLYQARFDASNWSGQLLAFALDGDPDSSSYGTVKYDGAGPQGSVWDAGLKIGEYDQRSIVTTVGGVPQPFRWTSFSASEKAAFFDDNPDVLDFVRGRDIAGMRERSTPLGDIVNSAPSYVSAPNGRFAVTLPPDEGGTAYKAFMNTHKDREGVIYVGANDGMLHAFDAKNGDELGAFIPEVLLPELKALADPGYGHRFYVDGSVTVSDAYIDTGASNSWQTVLVGGLNKGGQAIYALNVTDPDWWSETSPNPGKLVMWQFSDQDDADLGYTYSQPAIIRLADGTWAAAFGNGYNNTAADGHASSTGNAVLYLVDLATGDLLRKIDTGAGSADDPTGLGRPNGLATVSPVDLNGDQTVEVIYAGDLFGNLWKFDLSDDDASEWGVEYKLYTACAAPLVSGKCPSASVQSITTRPSVGTHPKGEGVMVYFGTGKYLETSDNNGVAGGRQTFHAVWDRGSAVSEGRTALLEQEILYQGKPVLADNTVSPSNIRVTSSHQPDWDAHKGWLIDLVPPSGAEGERQITHSVLRNGRILFTTSIPGDDPCTPGGKSWTMDLDANTGGQPSVSPWDLSQDGKFSLNDFVVVTIDGNEVKVPASGKENAGGNASTPNLIATLDGELSNTSSNEGLESESRNPGLRDQGRQSWRELAR